MFAIDEGYILAKKENLMKYDEITDCGIYQTGSNFIVMADELLVYSTKELSKDKLTDKVLTKGEMFAAKSFSYACTKEASIEIEGVGYISARRELIERINGKLDLRTYNVRPGKYIVTGKEEKGYRAPSFANHLKARVYKKGTVVNGVGFGISKNGYPRLKLDDGNYVTSNSNYVKFKGE